LVKYDLRAGTRLAPHQSPRRIQRPIRDHSELDPWCEIPVPPDEATPSPELASASAPSPKFVLCNQQRRRLLHLLDGSVQRVGHITLNPVDAVHSLPTTQADSDGLVKRPFLSTDASADHDVVH